MRIGECFYLPYTPPYKGGETRGAMTCRGYKDKERKTNYEILRLRLGMTTPLTRGRLMRGGGHPGPPL